MAYLHSRPLLSYDDISPAPPPLHSDQDAITRSRSSTTGQNFLDHSDGSGRPAKRGRWSNGTSQNSVAPRAHWDDPGEARSEMPYGPDDALTTSSGQRSQNYAPRSRVGRGGYHTQKGHELEPTKGQSSHHESKPSKPTSRGNVAPNIPKSISLVDSDMWDDRGLTSAWDAANEEYERLNGPGKSWKTEPVYKSSLWYDVPPKAPDPPKLEDGHAEDEDEDINGEGYEEDAKLGSDDLDPTIDPEAGVASQPGAALFGAVHGDAIGMSEEEAMQQVVNASYWLGYWTAVHELKSKGAVANKHLAKPFAVVSVEDEEE